MNLRIELTEAEANAVLGVVGPAVSAMRSPEGTALYEAERKIDGALLAAELAAEYREDDALAAAALANALARREAQKETER